MEFAIIDNGFVANVIVADQAFIDEFYPGAIDITDADPKPGPGWSYDGTTFTPPPAPEPPPPKTVFTAQEFRARYTRDELKNCDNPESVPGVAVDEAATVRTINASLLTADTIDLLNQNVIDAVYYQSQLNLITPARAAEILDPNSAPPAGAFSLA